MSVIHENLIRLENEVRMPKFVEDRYSKNKDSGIFAFDLPKEIINDFHDLRGHISIANARKNTKVLAITSSVPGEGSSTIVTNLGFLMAGRLARQLEFDKNDSSIRSNSPESAEDSNLSTFFTNDFRSVIHSDSIKSALDMMQTSNELGSADQNAEITGSLDNDKLKHRNEVLLVDANMQNPTLHKYFGLEQTPGLADILEKDVEWQRALHLVRDSDLCIITSGKNIANPAELLTSDKMRKILQILRSKFNYVIFDSPPVLTSVDAISLASVVDGVILIVRAGQTRWEIAQNAKRKLLSAEANLLGVALNRRKATIPDGLYRRITE